MNWHRQQPKMQIRGECGYAATCVLLGPPEEELSAGKEMCVLNGNNGQSGFPVPLSRWGSQLDCKSFWAGEHLTKHSRFLPLLWKYPSVYLAQRLLKVLANNFGLQPPHNSSLIKLYTFEWFLLIFFPCYFLCKCRGWYIHKNAAWRWAQLLWSALKCRRWQGDLQDLEHLLWPQWWEAFTNALVLQGCKSHGKPFCSKTLRYSWKSWGSPELPGNKLIHASDELANLTASPTLLAEGDTVVCLLSLGHVNVPRHHWHNHKRWSLPIGWA